MARKMGHRWPGLGIKTGHPWAPTSFPRPHPVISRIAENPSMGNFYVWSDRVPGTSRRRIQRYPPSPPPPPRISPKLSEMGKTAGRFYLRNPDSEIPSLGRASPFILLFRNVGPFSVGNAQPGILRRIAMYPPLATFYVGADQVSGELWRRSVSIRHPKRPEWAKLRSDFICEIRLYSQPIEAITEKSGISEF